MCIDSEFLVRFLFNASKTLLVHLSLFMETQAASVFVRCLFFSKGAPIGGYQASLLAQTVKDLPAMQETWVRSRGREDLLEKDMTAHASILTWGIPWTEEPGGLQSMGSQSQT